MSHVTANEAQVALSLAGLPEERGGEIEAHGSQAAAVEFQHVTAGAARQVEYQPFGRGTSPANEIDGGVGLFLIAVRV
jgi:hypothetical protein